MACSQCRGIERFFGPRQAKRQLKRYRRRGPDKTTRLLLAALEAEGVAGLTLLDIGGGIGAIALELLKARAMTATDVDASMAYLAIARAEAERQGLADRIAFRFGDFTDLAAELTPAGIVTLDRVICCYHDMPRLVDQSAAKAAKLYGLVYPRDTWWVRAGVAMENLLLRVLRNPFRVFVHATAAVDAHVRASGLTPRYQRTAGLWQVVVYARSS